MANREQQRLVIEYAALALKEKRSSLPERVQRMEEITRTLAMDRKQILTLAFSTLVP